MRSKKVLLANSLLLLALSIFVGIPILTDKIFKFEAGISGNTSLILSGCVSVLALGGISLLYCKIIKRNFTSVMVLKRISIKQFILVILVAVGTYIFAVGVNLISMKIFPVAIKDSQEISKVITSSSTLLGLIVVILIPAFFEEVFFRGVLLDAYEGVNKKIKYLLLILIFATFHGNVMQIVYVLFLGLILLKVREYTGTLLGSITLHAVNNGISYALSKVSMYFMKVQEAGIKNGSIDPKKVVTPTDAMNISLPQVIISASIFFLIGGTILYINLRKLKEYKAKMEGLKFTTEVPEVREENLLEDDKLVNGENLRNEEIINVDKNQYIPLVIYFVIMTVLVVLRY